MSVTAITFLKQFGRVDALFRGTALAGNLSFWALVALIPGFGPQGILFSAFVQLTISGLLDIPTSFFADRVGWHRSIFLGFLLKVFTTLTLAASAVFAFEGNTNLAQALLALEAIVDAFANAFLSGAFQAGFSSWYNEKCDDAKIPNNERPPLFVASFKYAIWMRIALPLVIIALGAASSFFQDKGAFTPFTVTVILGTLLFFRLATLVSATTLLRPATEKETPKPISMSLYITKLRLALKADSLALIEFALGSYVNFTVAFFFIPQGFKVLRDSGYGSGISWLGGTAVGFSAQLLAILLGRYAFARLPDNAIAKRFVTWSALYLGLGASAVAFCLYVLNFQGLSAFVTIFAYSVGAFFFSAGMTRAVLSRVLHTIDKDVRSVWTSLGETISQSVFGLVAGGLYLTGAADFDALIMLATTLVFSLFLCVYNLMWTGEANSIGARHSLRNYLGKRFFLAVCVLAVVSSTLDLGVYWRDLTQVSKRNNEYATELFLSSVRAPLIEGSFIEAKARVDRFVQQGQATCIQLSIWQDVLTQCNETATARQSDFVVTKPIYLFNQAEPIGELRAYFGNKELTRLLLARVVQSGLLFVVVAVSLYLFLRVLAQKLNGEVQNVIQIIQSPHSHPGTHEKCELSEFAFLATETTKVVKALEAASRQAALAQTAQMLAHDVRKPFSLLNASIHLLESSKNPEELRGHLAVVIPQTRRALESVNGLIQDVLEVSGNVHVATTLCSPTAMLLSCVEQIIESGIANGAVSLETQLEHTRLVQVDSFKVERVVSNILSNAFQAMNRTGRVWVRTKDVTKNDKTYVQIVIGNSGSEIAQKDIVNIFEPFFTKNKVGGTGLGLAIARKIVTAHGGEIWCDSKNNCVEFSFTLPATDTRDSSARVLPSRFEKTDPQSSRHSRTSETEPFLPNEQKIELAKQLQNLGRTLKIFLLDDEALYREGFYHFIRKEFGFGGLEITTASNVDDARRLVTESKPDIALLDYDLGSALTNGLDFARELHDAHPSVKVCLHSNRAMSLKELQSTLPGLAILPKPLHVAQFVPLLIDYIKSIGTFAKAANSVPAKAAKTKIALLDDSKIVHLHWQHALRAVADVDVFSSPEAFFERVNSSPKYLATLNCIVTDYFFGNTSSRTGLEILEEVRSKSEVPIFVCTDADPASIRTLAKTAVTVVGKDPKLFQAEYIQV